MDILRRFHQLYVSKRREPPENFFIEWEPYRRFLMRTRELAEGAESVVSGEETAALPGGLCGVDPRPFLS